MKIINSSSIMVIIAAIAISSVFGLQSFWLTEQVENLTNENNKLREQNVELRTTLKESIEPIQLEPKTSSSTTEPTKSSSEEVNKPSVSKDISSGTSTLFYIYSDFNGDGFSDIAIGSPNESVGVFEGAGSVNIIYGSSEGLSFSSAQTLHQNVEGLNTKVGADEHFGESLS